jgi:hypothetical protein
VSPGLADRNLFDDALLADQMERPGKERSLMTFSQLVIDNLESIAFYTSLVVMILGLLGLALVSFFWWLIASIYREILAKLGVAFFRFIAAAAAVASK